MQLSVKLTIIMLVIFFTIATIIFIQSYGYEEEHSVNGQENSTDTGLPSYEQFQYYMALNNIEEVRKIFDYCFDHATDPNPVQDLIDKGVIDSQKYHDTTCAQIKTLKDNFEKRLSETNVTSIIGN